MPAKKMSDHEFMATLSEQIKENTRAPNIKKYTPHQKQEVFHKSNRRGRLYIGGNRSGKTTGGVTEAIWRATCKHPYRPDLNAIGANRGRVVGVDFVNGVEKILYPQYKQWLYPSSLRGGSWDSAYDKFTRTLNFSNSSTIEFMSYDQDLDKFAGTSRHWVHFDEEPPKPIFNENMARLIDTNGEFWVTMTPVEGMTWIYEDLYEPNVNNPNGNIEVIEISMIENPFLKEEAIMAFANNVDSDEITTRVGGGFVVQGGRVYKNFDPTPGGPHVMTKPFEDPKKAFDNCLWIMGLDHGLNAPTAVLWMAIDPNGFAVCFDEHYHNEWTIKQHADFIKSKIVEHGRFPDILVADPSIVNRQAVTKTSIQEEYQKYGLSFIPGNNNVKDGIIRVKRYFNPDKYVGKKRSDAFGLENGDNFARLRITPNCVNLIKELKGYRWKTYANKNLQYQNNPYDEPHKKDDHACDALRYIIMTRPDLASATQDHDFDSVMRQLDQKIVMASDANYDDPRGLLKPDNPWTLENDMPSGNGDWEFDEHLGGVY